MNKNRQLGLIGWLSVAVVLAAFPALADPAAAQPVEFVVLGDMPYGEDQVGTLRYIGTRIRNEGWPFVIHYGDIKSGGTACTDERLRAHKEAIYALLPGAVFLTPGDNDWTDCDRPGAGGYDELERLAFFRDLAYDRLQMADPAWRVERQEGYPENARWRHGPLVLATLHVVGTDNGRAEILHSDVDAALGEVAARDAANIEWLEQTFGAAETEGAEGLVLAMQADPGELWDPSTRRTPCGPARPTDCNPYTDLLERLTDLAGAFDKPVLLVHGSTNNYCLDSGFGGWQAPRLWRFNGPGDFVVLDAAVVRFDASDPEPFRMRGVLTGDTPPPCTLRERLD